MRGGRVWKLSLSEHRVPQTDDQVSPRLLRARDDSLPHRAAVTLNTWEVPPTELGSQPELHKRL